MIESEVADNSESSDCACNFGNEDQQNNSESVSDSDRVDLGSEADNIELDALQEDDLKLLQTLLRGSLNGSLSNLFLCSKLDLPPEEMKGCVFERRRIWFSFVGRMKVSMHHTFKKNYFVSYR